MASHAREGHKAERKTREEPAAAQADAPPQSPLDFAQSVFRDPAQPMTLRAGMAKAALPYMHGRRAPANADADREQVLRLPPPFDQPDPYGALSVEWRDALEQAGLISPMHLLPSREAARSESEAGGVRASSASPARRSSSSRAPRGGVGADAAPQAGDEEEKKSMADVKARRRRSRDDTREQTQEETHEQRIERDPYDPHPGYRWI